MSIKNIFIYVIIFGSLSIFVLMSAEAQTKLTTLKGRVRNLTSGYTMPAQKVTLRIYHNDKPERGLQTMTNTNGEYRFTNLNVGKEWEYQLH